MRACPPSVVLSISKWYILYDCYYDPLTYKARILVIFISAQGPSPSFFPFLCGSFEFDWTWRSVGDRSLDLDQSLTMTGDINLGHVPYCSIILAPSGAPLWGFVPSTDWVTVTRMKITHFYVNPELSTLRDAAINYRQLQPAWPENIPRQVSPSPSAIGVIHGVCLWGSRVSMLNH